jgi:UDP-GlcNAc:undecaprenyl-phosphate/decaprenyl-phosphate GlcNAc-1-phosphate transferase
MINTDIPAFAHNILSLLFVMAVSFLVSPFVIWFSKKINLIAIPGKHLHHIHKRATPLSGGMIILITVLIAGTVMKLWQISTFVSCALAGLFILFFGIWDDLKGLNALIKLIGQVAATTFLMVNGIRIQFLESPQLYFGGPIIIYAALDILLTYTWIIGITNAINFVDSMDGLAVGLVTTALFFYYFGSIISGQVDITAICKLFIGVCVVLFYLNTAPARIFLGDSGAQTLGFIIAIVSILFSPKYLYQASSWFIPILVLAVPIFDTSLVAISRLRRKIPVYRSGIDHTYHRLVGFGMSSPRAVVGLIIVAVIIDCIAFFALIQRPVFSNLILFGCILAGVAAFFWLDSRKIMDKLMLYQEKNTRMDTEA